MLANGEATKEGAVSGCLGQAMIPPAVVVILVLALLRMKWALVLAGLVQMAVTPFLIIVIKEIHRTSNSDNMMSGFAELIIGCGLILSLPASVIWAVYLLKPRSRTSGC